MNITKHKNWSLAFLAVLACFFALNAAIWTGFTAEMLDGGEYVTPDLVRLGYISGSTLKRKAESTLPKKHIHSSQFAGQKIDVMTLGDSFSNISMLGRDPLYQDWIASLHGLSVMNVESLNGLDEVSTLIALANSGYLDRVRPRVLILELVERLAMEKLARPLDFGFSRPLSEIEKQYRQPPPEYTVPSVSFVNKANFKFLANAVLYRFSPNAFSSQVYAMELSAPMFSVPRNKRLLFYYVDLKTIGKADPASAELANENLNALARMLKKKKIALYFLPAPNKYTLYHDYIVNNPYPPSRFFELLRPLSREYVFVDAKKLLLDEVNRGEKDVYYPDDTHWSWKACKKIAESMRF